MNLEPILKARFSQFRSEYGLNNVKDSEAFEHFVNFLILSTHQPDVFKGDREFLEAVNVGDGNDMGIDGLAIKLNNVFIRKKSDTDDLLERTSSGNIEFIFIQSKNKTSLDDKELGAFLDGVQDFLSESPIKPYNSKVGDWLEIKQHLFSDEFLTKILWDKNPTIRAYYVVTGRRQEQEHHKATIEKFKRDIKKSPSSYDSVDVLVHGEMYLKDTYDNLVNRFSFLLPFVDKMELPEVEGVDDSCIMLCKVSEFMNMLSGDDGMIRRSLFNDNVRDYQGENTVNSEIEGTIRHEPNKFVLLNNGITIVCDKFVPQNRRILLENPQIVNGCQTSSVLFYASQKDVDISDVTIAIKLIATKNSEITNNIVRGTNRQNIVHDVAFETTRYFHQLLEDFFNSYEGSHHRIYYERRSKQYQYNDAIKYHQRISFKRLIEAFTAMFLNQPHFSHRHEYTLLREFQNVIFRDNHSKLTYYTAALSVYVLDRLIQDKSVDLKTATKYKGHILMIFREMVAGNVPNLNGREKDVDAHCEKVIAVLNDEQDARIKFEECIQWLNNQEEEWLKKEGTSPFGTKDNSDFTSFLLHMPHGKKHPQKVENLLPTGEVIKTDWDVRGRRYGFISSTPKNLFFHEDTSPSLNFNKLKGVIVQYELSDDPVKGNKVAVNVKRIDEL